MTTKVLEISNDDDVIDSRDILARIEELESERQDLQDAIEDAEEGEKGAAEDALIEWDEDAEGTEFKALQSLADEAEGCSADWKYGATLVRDTYFTKYVKEFCRDIGDMPREIPDYIVIDWDATADNIRQDYTSVQFNGVEYWVRYCTCQ